jgi:hypothetical protein
MQNEIIQYNDKLGTTFIARKIENAGCEPRVYIGVSRCKAPDIFSKKEGYRVAENNLEFGLMDPYDVPRGKINYFSNYFCYLQELQLFRQRAKNYFKGIQVIVSGAK